MIFQNVTNGFQSTWGANVYADIYSIVAIGHPTLDAIRTALSGRTVLKLAR